MPRAVLFLNGDLADPLSFYQELLRDDDIVVAVDGGSRHCRRLGLLPALAIGDFDSTPPDLQEYYRQQQVEVLSYPAAKDATDSALAVEEMLRRGVSEIFLLGALGGRRTDMTLANILMLAAYEQPLAIVDATCEIRCLREGDRHTIKGRVGDYLSWLVISERAVTGPSDGVRYPLDNLRFQRGETRPVSNEITAAVATVSLREGVALLVIQKP